jgi:hypothetical protein
MKKVRESDTRDEWTPVTITFGSVTVHTKQAPESICRANIKAGQDALRRAKKAIISPGVELPRKMGVPLYYGCDAHPGLIVRELDGRKSLGTFSSGRFRVVDREIGT